MICSVTNKAILSPLGSLPHDWRLVKLKEITKKIGSGATPRGGQSVYLPFRQQYALIRSQNVYDRYFSNEGLVFISDEEAEHLQGVKVQSGDILLNITGDGITFGRATLAPKNILPACVNQHVAIIRPNPEVCSADYLLSYLTHPLIKKYIESFNAGGSRRAITKGHIESFEIPLPPLTEQKAIAHVLGALDDKIELNRQLNETLSAIAKALFKSWFLDFDAVRAKLKGEKPYGLDTETVDLFPDLFEDSILGMVVPKGWSIQPLDQIANFLNGLALQKYPPNDDEYLPVIKIAELRRGISESSDKASSKIEKKYIVEDGDVLFSWSGSLEVVIWCGGRGALNQHLFKVTSSKYPKWFYFQWIKYHLPEFQAIAAGKATTMGHIQRHHLSTAYIVVPPENILNKANQVMAPILDMIVNNEKESRSLTTIRNSLLPKLLSGEIRVKEAEKVLEAHL